MAVASEVSEIYVSQLKKLYQDANYSAQTYFEACKITEFYGRLIVFLPAVVAAVAGVVVAFNGPKAWGAVVAVSGAVTATASFLGASRNSARFSSSAREFTKLRHLISLEISLTPLRDSISALEETVQSLFKSYNDIVGDSDPVPGRAFKLASKRIADGVLDYS